MNTTVSLSAGQIASTSGAPRSSFLRRLGAIATTTAVFIIDTVTSLDIAIAVLYVAVILMSVNIFTRRGLTLVSLICLALTIMSFALSHGQHAELSAIARCLVSIAAIGITTVLALSNKAAYDRLKMDIIAARQAEEALHRAQTELAHVTRVTTLGELAASIAHEVNQPLAAVTTNAEASRRWLNRQEPDINEALQALERILGETFRASEVIRRIRALARKADPQRAPVDLKEVIEDSVALVAREIQLSGVQLMQSIAEDVPCVTGDRIQLQQVLINLLINGMQAMGGKQSSPRTLSLCLRHDGQNEVILEVRDSGPGIAADNMSRLFNAFFTTKPQGMGMGLSICRSIIEAHGGRIWAQSQPGEGATLLFALPRQQVAAGHE